MRRLLVLLTALIVIGAAAPTAAAGPFATPEEAVAAYIEAVAARDFDAIMATTSAAELRSGFDFVAYTDRLQAMTPVTPVPATDPLLIAINDAQFASTIASQVKFLAYGLLTPTAGVLEGRAAPMDAAGAAAFVEALDMPRLGELRIEQIGAPNPKALGGERYAAGAARNAEAHGAEEMTERVALVAFDGRHYVIGFTLLRYAAGWTVQSQYSAMAGLSVMGMPTPSSPDNFAAMTAE